MMKRVMLLVGMAEMLLVSSWKENKKVPLLGNMPFPPSPLIKNASVVFVPFVCGSVSTRKRFLSIKKRRGDDPVCVLIGQVMNSSSSVSF